MKQLNIGYSDFKNIILNNYYYVDKSLLIEELINSQTAIALFPRPRRFGKTVNLSMLNYFFDCLEPENINLFNDLKISKYQDIITKHCCKYPVIFLTFKDAKANTWNETFEYIKNEIVKTYEKHSYLLKTEQITIYKKAEYERILSKTATLTEYATSIQNLTDYLAEYHKKSVVILIDEYDTPIQSGYNKFYEEVISFMRTLMSGAFKDNKHIFKGAVTGILRVSKESIFSGVNNLTVYSILNDEFADKFGFTEDELIDIINDFQLQTKHLEIKQWYNGYRFGTLENIYNPWSVLNFVISRKKEFTSYWTNTSSNELIKNEIKKRDADLIRQEILTLISGETIDKDIEENFVFPDLNTNKDLLWSLLVYSGYLTFVNKLSRKKYSLKIPNYEIKTIYQDTILEWLNIELKIQKTLLEQTAEYLITNEIDKFEHGFRKIMGDTFSYYDTKRINEYIYHAYLLGLLAIIGDDYIIKSNRESGSGRYDIVLIPYDKNKYGVVIEIKQIEAQKKKETEQELQQRINDKINDAEEQINKNKYYKELLDNKIPMDKIIRLPIVFVDKEVFIKKINSTKIK